MMSKTPNVRVLVLNDPGSYAQPGCDGDKGCAGCGQIAEDGDNLVVDGRGRYWHDRCAADYLGDIERPYEQRLTQSTGKLAGRHVAGGLVIVPKATVDALLLGKPYHE
jgi:hypothetical protein